MKTFFRILIQVLSLLFMTAVASTSLKAATPAIDAGGGHSLFLKADGSVWATGENYQGQLGTGTVTNRSTPVQVMTGVQAIAAGYSHSLFLKTDGSVWATGSNGAGQLGDGTMTNRITPVQVMTGVQAIEAGLYHSLFLKTDSSVWATRGNAFGELGDSTTTDRSTPVQVITGVQAIAAKYERTACFSKPAAASGPREKMAPASLATAPRRAAARRCRS